MRLFIATAALLAVQVCTVASDGNPASGSADVFDAALTGDKLSCMVGDGVEKPSSKKCSGTQNCCTTVTTKPGTAAAVVTKSCGECLKTANSPKLAIKYRCVEQAKTGDAADATKCYCGGKKNCNEKAPEGDNVIVAGVAKPDPAVAPATAKNTTKATTTTTAPAATTSASISCASGTVAKGAVAVAALKVVAGMAGLDKFAEGIKYTEGNANFTKIACGKEESCCASVKASLFGSEGTAKACAPCFIAKNTCEPLGAGWLCTCSENECNKKDLFPRASAGVASAGVLGILAAVAAAMQGM